MTEDQFELLESDVLTVMVDRVKEGIAAKERQQVDDHGGDKSNKSSINQAVASPSNMDTVCPAHTTNDILHRLESARIR